jgi:hypothetical protein
VLRVRFATSPAEPSGTQDGATKAGKTASRMLALQRGAQQAAQFTARALLPTELRLHPFCTSVQVSSPSQSASVDADMHIHFAPPRRRRRRRAAPSSASCASPASSASFTCVASAADPIAALVANLQLSSHSSLATSHFPHPSTRHCCRVETSLTCSKQRFGVPATRHWNRGSLEPT